MATSLMSLTCSCVIENINLVECLCGLPELIGEYLFRHLIEYYLVTNDGVKLLHGLRVFAEAYGPLLLRQLNLSKRLLTINEYTECLLPLITNLVTLDLSHCQLGMDHEIMQHFVATDMTHLQTLVVRNCALSDEDLRKLTIPCRMYKRGLIHLRELDLSCNPKLTTRSLQFLICLKDLNLLILSETSILCSEAELFGNKAGLTLDNNDSTLVSSLKISNEGWAETLMQHWISKSEELSQKKPLLNTRTQAACFYSRCRVRLEVIKELKAFPPPKRQSSIRLIRKRLPGIELKIKKRHASISLQDILSSNAATSNDIENLAKGNLQPLVIKQSHKRKLVEALDAIDE